jgi:hypothetical protein
MVLSVPAFRCGLGLRWCRCVSQRCIHARCCQARPHRVRRVALPAAARGRPQAARRHRVAATCCLLRAVSRPSPVATAAGRPVGIRSCDAVSATCIDHDPATANSPLREGQTPSAARSTHRKQQSRCYLCSACDPQCPALEPLCEAMDVNWRYLLFTHLARGQYHSTVMATKMDGTIAEGCKHASPGTVHLCTWPCPSDTVPAGRAAAAIIMMMVVSVLTGSGLFTTYQAPWPQAGIMPPGDHHHSLIMMLPAARRARPGCRALNVAVDAAGPASGEGPGVRSAAGGPGPATRRPGAATGNCPGAAAGGSRLPAPTRTRSRRRRAPLHSVAWRSLMAWTSRGHSTQRLNHASTGPGQPSHGHSVLS